MTVEQIVGEELHPMGDFFLRVDAGLDVEKINDLLFDMCRVVHGFYPNQIGYFWCLCPGCDTIVARVLG